MNDDLNMVDLYINEADEPRLTIKEILETYKGYNLTYKKLRLAIEKGRLRAAKEEGHNKNSPYKVKKSDLDVFLQKKGKPVASQEQKTRHIEESEHWRQRYEDIKELNRQLKSEVEHLRQESMHKSMLLQENTKLLTDSNQKILSLEQTKKKWFWF